VVPLRLLPAPRDVVPAHDQHAQGMLLQAHRMVEG
jgi:hypothetical protein